MKKDKREIVLILMVLLLVMVFACERNITTIEQITEKKVVPAENCFNCHSDEETWLVAAAGQWANSQHASGENINRNTEPCTQCHTSEGFVHWAETGEVLEEVFDPTAIHCFTCHAPHTNENFFLRYTDVPPLQNGEDFDLGDANICVACHQSRRNVDTYISSKETFTSVHWGPHHSNQGDMLIGSNGYEYDNYDYGRTNHRSATSEGCLDCHFEVRNSYFLGGHSFNMKHEEEHNVAACAQCHSDMEEAEDFNRVFVENTGIQDSVTTLIETLSVLLENAGLIGIDPEEGHLLPIEDVVTNADSAGAVWNWLMAEEDQSHGVHNPQYTIDLLYSSILYMQGSLTSSTATVIEAKKSTPLYAKQ